MVTSANSSRTKSEADDDRVVVYRYLDYVLCLVVVTPFVVLAFRGLWVFEDFTLFPDNPVQSCFISFLLGHFVIFLFYLAQNTFQGVSKDPSKNALFFLIRPLYKFVFAGAFINQWRCVWLVYGIFLDNELYWALRVAAASILSLAVLRSLPLVCCSPPLFLSKDIDDPGDVFSCRTRFNTKCSKWYSKYIIDCGVSVFFIQSLVVFFWRSCWTILDVAFFCYPFPYFQFAGLVFGSLITLSAYKLQHLVYAIDQGLNGVPKILLRNIWFIMGGFSSVLTWHGLWSSFDVVLGFEPVVSLCSYAVALYFLSSFFDVSLIYVKSILVENDDIILFKISYLNTADNEPEIFEKKTISRDDLESELSLGSVELASLITLPQSVV